MADVKRGNKPTLKTIAQMSGLAVPTVSRALNDAPDIGKNTKELVRRIASEIGYVPNRAGVRLRTGKTNVISLVLSTENDMMNHTARLLSSIAGRLRETPYHMIVTPYFPDEDPLRAVKYIVETGSADAIIMNQTKPDDPRVQYLIDKQFPFATHGRTSLSDKHPYYDYDNEAYGRLAVETLVARGRKNILMIAPPFEQNYSVIMRKGASDAAAELGVKFRVIRRVTSDTAGEEVRAKISEILNEEDDVDGLITGSTTSAMACAGACEAHGMTIGKDIDIFSKEAIPFLRYFREDIIVVYENVSHAGDFLAQATIQAINSPELPPMQGLDGPDESSIRQ